MVFGFKMNFNQKLEERKSIRDLFLSNYPEGCLKLTSGESHLHARVKSEVFYWLKVNNFDVWSGPTLKGLRLRPDILCLHKNGTVAYILEIVCSETESSLINKEINYPLPVIKVDAKLFKYEDFKI